MVECTNDSAAIESCVEPPTKRLKTGEEGKVDGEPSSENKGVDEADTGLLDFDFDLLGAAQLCPEGEVAPVDTSEPPLRKKQRGGNKESHKRRKREKRQDEQLRLKEVGDVPDAGGTASSSGSAPAKAAGKGPVRQRSAEAEARRESTLSHTLFITNLSFKATEDELRGLLGKAGELKQLRLGRDKATNKLLGYAHAVFADPAEVERATKQLNGLEVNDRVLRAMCAKDDAKRSVEFQLPNEIQEDLRSLLREGYQGKNISAVKDAWDKRHEGKKLHVGKWGFKNFSNALKSIPGIRLEPRRDEALEGQLSDAIQQETDIGKKVVQCRTELDQLREEEGLPPLTAGEDLSAPEKAKPASPEQAKKEEEPKKEEPMSSVEAAPKSLLAHAEDRLRDAQAEAKTAKENRETLEKKVKKAQLTFLAFLEPAWEEEDKRTEDPAADAGSIQEEATAAATLSLNQ